ncbi:MAG: UDP-N-acetylmuramoyl-L-alanine--D-glutamate ligase [Gammaproteobacteria bacterium]|nr:UDP-N-acetylmuramoyl-L-alanine--D-glutamate ligase [Gammaproteobacteria bacterium]
MKNNASRTAIIGLGKTGISVAKYLKNNNLNFDVYDTRKNLFITNEITKYINIENIFLGNFNKDIIKNYENFIVSPGIKLKKEFINEILKKNKNIETDIDIYNKDNSCKTICITGSNGKTTVTSMLEHVLVGLGKKAMAGGNIGLPALELLNENNEYNILELSSFQLEMTKKINCIAATITNITPDHLDRHGTFENYIKIKHKIFNDTKNIIINREDENILKDNFNYRFTFGGNKPKNNNEFGISKKKGKRYIFHGNKKLLSEDQIKLIGGHNLINICTCLCILYSLKFEVNDILDQIKSFLPIEHRMENFYNNGKVRWINDSKATNIDSTMSAINSLEENIILILGGRTKEDNYNKLNKVITNKVCKIIIYGESRNTLEKIIKDKYKVSKVVNIKDAVFEAKQIAQKIMDNQNCITYVLLSPACSSYDMFESYEERGLYFKKCVID